MMMRVSKKAVWWAVVILVLVVIGIGFCTARAEAVETTTVMYVAEAGPTIKLVDDDGQLYVLTGPGPGWLKEKAMVKVRMVFRKLDSIHQGFRLDNVEIIAPSKQ